MADIVGTANPETLTGSAEADRIQGLAGDDSLYGYDGADTLDAGDGDDFLYGGSGDDILIGGAGEDFLYGQSGLDTASYEGALVGLTLDLTETYLSTGDAAGDFFYSVETFRLTAFDDQFIGAGAADIVDGGAGRDRLLGMAGNDTLSGGENNDVLVGGAGADTLDGGTGEDWASYRTSTVGLTVNLLQATLSTGDAAGDTYLSVEGIELGRFADTLVLSGDVHLADGGDGSDVITGSNGNDTMWGGHGNDRMDGSGGNDVLYAGARDGSVDTLDVFAVNRLFGGYGHDQLFGDIGADELWGGIGNDILEGGSNNDLLFGESGTDTLRGGEGSDELTGGTGADMLDGGTGYDVARYISTVRIDFLNSANNTGDALGDTFEGIEEIRFLGADDVNRYVGGTHAYTIVAVAGEAQFTAGKSAEFFRGLNGNMTVSYATSTLGVTLTGQSGLLVGTRGAAGDKIEGATNIVLTGVRDVVDLSSLSQGIDILAGSGNDAITLGINVSGMVYGGAGHDVIDGGFDGGTIFGESGNDTMTITVDEGSLAQPTLDGGAGADSLTLRGGGGTLLGGAGNDILFSSNQTQQHTITARGDAGNDTITLFGQAAAVADADGGLGIDTIAVNDFAIATVRGGLANDSITVIQVLSYSIFGDGGNDMIAVSNLIGTTSYGGTINGGIGNDSITGATSYANVFGDDGDDTITLTGHGLDISGDGGGDTIDLTLVLRYDDYPTVDGGAGNDMITIDVDQTLSSNAVTSLRITGGTGDDRINGFDTGQLLSGRLDEHFVFSAGWGDDTVTGFNDIIDRIGFTNTGVAGPHVFSDLVVTGDSSSTTIAFGTDSITLSGLDVANFSADDVWFLA